MKERNYDWWAISMMILVLIIIILTFMITVSQERRQTKFCLDNGWAGKVISPDGRTGLRVCYKDQPHSSGVGTERVYSGVIE